MAAQHPIPTGRANLKVIAFVVTLCVLLVAGGAVGLTWRRHALITDAQHRAATAIGEKRWDDARRELKYYLAKKPTDLDARARYAMTCLRVTPPKLSDAANALRFILQKRPGDADVCHRLGMLYYRGRDFDDAAYVCRQRLKKDPADRDAALLLGQALVSRGSFDDAETVLRALVEKDTGYPDAYVLLSSIAMRRDSAQARATAADWLDQAVSANPESAAALAYRARFRRTVLHDVDGARSDMVRTDRCSPTDPWVMLLLTEQWAELGDLDRARAYLDRVKSIDRDRLMDREMYLAAFDLARFVTEARVVLMLDSPDRAVQLADQARTDLSADQVRAVLRTLTELYLKAGRADRAEQLVNECSIDRPAPTADHSGTATDVNLAVSSALVESRRHRWYAVINLLEPLAATDALTDATAWSLLARAYFETDQVDRAVASWDRAFVRGPMSLEDAGDFVHACLSRDLIKGYRVATTTRSAYPDSIEARLLQADVLVSAAVLGWVAPDLIEKLKTDLNQWATQYPTNGKVRILLAALAAVDDRPDDVVRLLHQVLQNCDRKREALNSLVTYHVTRGRIDQAIQACRQAAQTVPDLADPRVFLARLLAGKNRFDDARQVLVQAADQLHGPERLQAQTALADLLVRNHRTSDAVLLLSELTKQHPRNVHIRAELIKLPAVQEDTALARSLLDELRAIEGDRGLRWRFAEALLTMAGDDWSQQFNRITTLLKYCIQHDDDWSEPVIALGALYERAEEPDDAEQVYRSHFDRHPNHLAVAIKLLELLERRRRFADADTVLQRIPADLADMSSHRVNIAIGRGRYNDAIAELERRRASNPGDAVARVILAELLYQVHRDAAAAFALLDEAHRAQPDMRSVTSTRLEVLRTEGRIEEANAITDREVEQHHDFAAYLMRAGHRDACGLLDAAERDYKRLTGFDAQAPDGFLALGDFYFRHDRLGDAITTWRQGLAKSPQHPGLVHRIIEALLTNAHPAMRQEGREMLDRQLATFPDDTVLLQLHAADLLRRRTTKTRTDAVRILEGIIRTDPRNIKACLKLVQLADESGRTDRAMSLVNQALGANPGSVPLVLARAGLEREQGNLVTARSLAESVLDTHPDNIAARILLADVARARGERTRALQLTEQVLQDHPQDKTAVLLHASLLRDDGRVAQATGELREYCQTPGGKTSPTALAQLALLHIAVGDYSAAASRLDAAEALAPNSPAVLRARLQWLAATRRYDDLVKTLSDRPEELVTPPALFTFAGTLLLRTGDSALLPKAISLFDRVINSDANPRDISDAELAKAQAAYQLDDLDQSERSYRRVLKHDPYQAQALNNLAWILCHRRDQPDDALELADRGLARHPDDTHLLDTRGTILHRLSQPDRAAADLRRCIELSTTDPAQKAKALVHLAAVLEDQHRHDPAQRYAREAIAIDDEHHVLAGSDRKRADSVAAD